MASAHARAEIAKVLESLTGLGANLTALGTTIGGLAEKLVELERIELAQSELAIKADKGNGQATQFATKYVPSPLERRILAAIGHGTVQHKLIPPACHPPYNPDAVKKSLATLKRYGVVTSCQSGYSVAPDFIHLLDTIGECEDDGD